jgi:hypothetical protein
LNGTGQRGHSEACRARMLIEIGKYNKDKIEAQEVKENEFLAKRVAHQDVDPEVQLKRQRREAVDDHDRKTSLCQDRSSSSSSGGIEIKRVREDDPLPEIAVKRMKDVSAEEENMEVNHIYDDESLMQEDFKWEINQVSDMCSPDAEIMLKGLAEIEYYDETSWRSWTHF